MEKKLLTAIMLCSASALCLSVMNSMSVRSMSNREVVNVANVDRLISLAEDQNTNHMKLLTSLKMVDDDLGREIKDRRALEAVVEQNAKELIRISGNLERDVDKMYTNIVMFGVTVFAAQQDISALALRIQDLERGGAKPQVPTVNAAKPALVPSDSTDPYNRETSNEKLKERLDIGPADLGPAPTN